MSPRLRHAAPVAALLLGLAACSGTPDTDRTWTPEPSVVAPSPTPSTSPTPTEPVQAWPADVPQQDAMYGGFLTTAVWIAVAEDPEGPVTEAAYAALEDKGYEGSLSPVACHGGPEFEAMAREITGVGPHGNQPWGVVLYFRTSAEAQQFVDLWGGDVLYVHPDDSVGCDWG